VIGENWGLNHIDAWSAVPGVEVAAICTSRRETAEAVNTQRRRSLALMPLAIATEAIEPPGCLHASMA